MSTHARAQRASWPLLALVACLSGVGSAFAQREAESLSESFRKAAERGAGALIGVWSTLMGQPVRRRGLSRIAATSAIRLAPT